MTSQNIEQTLATGDCNREDPGGSPSVSNVPQDTTIQAIEMQEDVPLETTYLTESCSAGDNHS